jgi:LysR family glycine cleavage system transcriptional activator
MAEQTPPFTALRAVEAASRHKSFTWAAKELSVTHSAVSQSIRRLEAELGTVLFQRRDGAMEPSEAALKLAHAYSSAAEALGATLRDITGKSAAAPLSLLMPGDFGRQWFAARLPRLTDAVPDVQFDIFSTGQGRESADAEILFDAKPRHSDETLADIDLFPVASPAYLAREPIVRADEVVGRPLYADRRFGWDIWAARFLPRAAAPKAHVMDDSAMALEAATQGGGLALAHQFSAEALIESGKAVALPFVAPAPMKLVLRIRPGGGRNDALARLAMWLKLEIGRGAAMLRSRRSDVI